MRATCPRSASSGYHAEFHEGYQKHTNPLNYTTSSSDISGYHKDFHEGHGTVEEWQGAAWAWTFPPLPLSPGETNPIPTGQKRKRAKQLAERT
jgi:hypothetical protein